MQYDIALHIDLLTTDGKTVAIETIAGVVPDYHAIPTDVLLGRAIYQKLGIKHMPDGSLQASSLQNSPILQPAKGDLVFPLHDEEIPSEIQHWKAEFPTLFDPIAKRDDAPLDHGIRHEIDVGDSSPINLPARTYSPAHASALDEFVDKGLRHGIIRESNSPLVKPSFGR